MKSYDYIICGAGCAGLSLAMHLIQSGKFGEKKVLLIEQGTKKQNDRTWCYWEQGKGPFESIVHKQWQKLKVYGKGFSKTLHIQPYAYKLIRGIDFYNYCLALIKCQPNFEVIQATVTAVNQQAGGAAVVTEAGTYVSGFVFNSVLFNPPVLQKRDIWLLQHFKGWYIKTDKAAFDPAVGTLMDFRTDQKEGTSFFYMLPFSATEALVEYTLFSPELLADEKYENALQDYIIQRLGVTGFAVLEKEFGVIPMTNHLFDKGRGSVVNIGTAGGYTKGSSGYTFQFIQKSSAAIVASLIARGDPFEVQKTPRRFSFYDSVLLRVLQSETVEGADVFTTLFKKNKPQAVLKFLDNETKLSEELEIITTLPTLPFAKAAVKQIF